MKVTCEHCGADFDLEDDGGGSAEAPVACAHCGKAVQVTPAGDVASEGRTVDQQVLDLDRHLRAQEKKGAEATSRTAPMFVITKDDNCPLYTAGDELQLSGKIFLVPPGKAPCLILAKDLVKILNRRSRMKDPDPVFRCTGCTGRIHFKYRPAAYPDARPVPPAEEPGRAAASMEAVIELLRGFSIFKNLSDDELQDLVSFLRLDKYSDGDIILRKGDPGRNLFIIVSGRVEVLSEDGMSIAFMGGGEVFGEMSLLSGDPVGATIKVVEPATVLYIGAKDFKRVINEIPMLQLNFTRLLARRMAEINMARSEEFASGMTGKLSEMPPAELFQTLNVNQKTGVLTLKLPRESAYLSFREGELVSARFRNLDGQDAFFELLKAREGRFKFIPGLSAEEMEAAEIGDFMHLLMEGLRKIDEDDKNFLKTMIPNLT
jgi:CRP/FNR family transcriptional regulator, cyclic AMP receptor protein